jgi:hypothetical protein
LLSSIDEQKVVEKVWTNWKHKNRSKDLHIIEIVVEEDYKETCRNFQHTIWTKKNYRDSPTNSTNQTITWSLFFAWNNAKETSPGLSLRAQSRNNDGHELWQIKAEKTVIAEKNSKEKSYHNNCGWKFLLKFLNIGLGGRWNITASIVPNRDKPLTFFHWWYYLGYSIKFSEKSFKLNYDLSGWVLLKKRNSKIIIVSYAKGDNYELCW